MIKIPVAPTTHANAVSAVTTGSQNLINAWKDYAVTREVEVTKRTQISANRDAQLAKIQDQRDVLWKLIDGTFAERAKNFDAYFAMLDDGFASGDEKKIDVALELIVTQTKVSPMMQAAQLISKINDPENTDVIDI